MVEKDFAPQAFVDKALKGPCEHRIPGLGVLACYEQLAEAYKKRGLSGRQITDLCWQHLVAFCPSCERTFDGQTIGDKWIAARMSDRANETLCCGTKEMILFWRPLESSHILQRMKECGAELPEDLSPSTHLEGDEAALKAYWRRAAAQWWKGQNRAPAVCDKCMASIDRGDGYLSQMYSDLVCDRCCEDRLTPQRLEAMYGDKSSAVKKELRLARGAASQNSNSQASTSLASASKSLVDRRSLTSADVAKVSRVTEPLLYRLRHGQEKWWESLLMYLFGWSVMLLFIGVVTLNMLLALISMGGMIALGVGINYLTKTKHFFGRGRIGYINWVLRHPSNRKVEKITKTLERELRLQRPVEDILPKLCTKGRNCEAVAKAISSIPELKDAEKGRLFMNMDADLISHILYFFNDPEKITLLQQLEPRKRADVLMRFSLSERSRLVTAMNEQGAG